MKKSILPILAVTMAFLAVARADDSKHPATPPLVIQPAPVPDGTRQVYVYDQKPLAGLPALITPQQAQEIVDQFRANYAKLGSPRLLIYVNRELVDEQSGMELSGRSERIETTRNAITTDHSSNAPETKDSVTTHTVTQNRYHSDGKAEPTLADRQTVRDVERLMGRPLRSAGATLVDQHLAAQLIGDKALDSITTDTEQARKGRAAANKIADVVVEVLISSRNVTVAEVSGDKVYAVPDIQMTAIRLRDAKVIGQAAASDVISKGGGVGYAARNFSVQAITEATALALMDDILTETK